MINMRMKKASELSVSDLVKQQFGMSENGWHKEIWLNLKKETISFSGWMTQNSWNESENENIVCVGTVDSMSISDVDGIYEINLTNDERYYIIKDGEEFIDNNFHHAIKNGYEVNSSYDDYDSIIENKYSVYDRSDILSVITDIASNDGWYDEIFEKIDFEIKQYKIKTKKISKKKILAKKKILEKVH